MFPGKSCELQLGPWHGSEKTEGSQFSERHGMSMSAKPGLAPSKKRCSGGAGRSCMCKWGLHSTQRNAISVAMDSLADVFLATGEGRQAYI